jgi:uncharacterized membrane protein YbaN (DUF454 family)
MKAGRLTRGGREGRPSLKKPLWVAAGLFFLGLGVLGVFVPLLPTTPFLLLASACLLRGSSRLHRRLLRHPLLGSPIRHYREEHAIPGRFKAVTLALLWVTILFSAFFVVR